MIDIFYTLLSHSFFFFLSCLSSHFCLFYNNPLCEHQLIHGGGLPYYLDVCIKSSGVSSQFKTHQCKHGDKQPYAFDACNKSFSLFNTFICSFIIGWQLVRYVMIQKATLKQLLYRNNRVILVWNWDWIKELEVRGLSYNKITSDYPLTKKKDTFSDESKRRAYWVLCSKMRQW